MKDYFEASRKVAAEIAHLEVLRRFIPAKITALGESLAAQLVAALLSRAVPKEQYE